MLSYFLGNIFILHLKTINNENFESSVWVIVKLIRLSVRSKFVLDSIKYYLTRNNGTIHTLSFSGFGSISFRFRKTSKNIVQKRLVVQRQTQSWMYFFVFYKGGKEMNSKHVFLIMEN